MTHVQGESEPPRPLDNPGDGPDPLMGETAVDAEAGVFPDEAGAVNSDDADELVRTLASRPPLLTSAEEVELAKAIEAGVLAGEQISNADEDGAMLDPAYAADLLEVARIGQEAMSKMVAFNEGLVKTLAERYSGYARTGIEYNDLLQVGRMALVVAVRRFNYVLGNRFSTLATRVVANSMQKAIASQSRTIHIGEDLALSFPRIRAARSRLLSELGREPAAEELAQASDTPSDWVEVWQQYDQGLISLDAPARDDDPDLAPLGNVLVDVQEVGPAEVATSAIPPDAIQQLLSGLSERDAGIIRLRFGLDDGQQCTQAEVAKVYGLTRQRIAQIESWLMGKLRPGASAMGLRPYIED